MPEQAEHMGAVDQAALAALIDKLVAVQLDLKPLCHDRASSSAPQPMELAVAAACAVLQSAIEDLRDIVHKLGQAVRLQDPASR